MKRTVCVVVLLAMAPFGCEAERTTNVHESRTTASPLGGESNVIPTGDCVNLLAAGVEFCVPTAWISEPVQGGMRLAQYRLEGRSGAAELVIYHFGPGQGGTREANVQRWVGQFSADTPDGTVSWSTEADARGGLEMTLVRVSGTYAPGAMGPNAPRPAPKVGQSMFGLIVEGGGQGTVYVKAVGPKTTIQSHHDLLMQFMRSAKRSARS